MPDTTSPTPQQPPRTESTTETTRVDLVPDTPEGRMFAALQEAGHPDLAGLPKIVVASSPDTLLDRLEAAVARMTPGKWTEDDIAALLDDSCLTIIHNNARALLAVVRAAMDLGTYGDEHVLVTVDRRRMSALQAALAPFREPQP